MAVFGFLAPMLLLMKIPIVGPLLFLPVCNRCCTLGVGLVGCNVSYSVRPAAFVGISSGSIPGRLPAPAAGQRAIHSRSVP